MVRVYIDGEYGGGGTAGENVGRCPIDVGNDGDGVLQETADERFIVSTNFMYICRLFGEMSRLSTSARHDKATQNYDQTQIHT